MFLGAAEAAAEKEAAAAEGEEEEEETGEISVLLFGPQGEEPVVDSTLQREGAAHRGKTPFT